MTLEFHKKRKRGRPSSEYKRIFENKYIIEVPKGMSIDETINAMQKQADVLNLPINFLNSK